MTKEMIISTNGHETRVAILEDDLLAEVFVERERNRGVVGNVYKGRVSKVLPGMQSAFVDLGLERDGFLYVSDVVNTMEEFERLSGDDDEEEPAARPARSAAAPPKWRPTAAAAVGGLGGPPRRPRARRPRSRRAGQGARGQDRGAGQGRPGHHRAGRQGAARHQGRATHLARHHARPLPGLHADRRPRRRVAQDLDPRGAQPAARHRQGVPRAAPASAAG